MSSMRDCLNRAWSERQGPVVLTTVDTAGVPNSIYVGCVRMEPDGRIVIADNHMVKTRANLMAGSPISLLFMTERGKSYQLKGCAQYYTEGALLDAVCAWSPPSSHAYAAIELAIESMWSGSECLYQCETVVAMS